MPQEDHHKTQEFLRRRALASRVRKVEAGKWKVNFLKISLNLREGTRKIGKGSIEFYPM